MIIKKIEAYNFMQYPELILDNIPEKGTIGIFGKNECGKSTIADSLSFALFGDIPRAKMEGYSKGFKKTDFVMWGAKQCDVNMIFQVGEKKFEVQRKIKAKGPTNAELIDLDTGEVLASKTKPVNDYIKDRILGYGFQEFRYSSYVAQKEVDLIIQSSKDVKPVINNMLGITLLNEAATECFRENKRIKDDILPQIESTLKIHDERLTEREEWRTEALEKQVKLKEVQDDIKKIETDIKLKDQEVKKLEKIKEIEAKRSKLKDLLKEKTNYQIQLDKELKEAKEADKAYKARIKTMEDDEIKSMIEKDEVVENSIKILSLFNSTKERAFGLKKETDLLKKGKDELEQKKNTLEQEKKNFKLTDHAKKRYDIYNAIKTTYEDLKRIENTSKNERKRISIELKRKRNDLKKQQGLLNGVSVSQEDERLLEQIKAIDIQKKSIKEELNETSKKAKTFLLLAAIFAIVGIILIMIQPIIGIIILLGGSGSTGAMYAQKAKKSNELKKLNENYREQESSFMMKKGQLEERKRTKYQLEEQVRILTNNIHVLEVNFRMTGQTLAGLKNIYTHQVLNSIKTLLKIKNENINNALKPVLGIPPNQLSNITYSKAVTDLPKLENTIDKRKESAGIIKQLDKEIIKLPGIGEELKEKTTELTDNLNKLADQKTTLQSELKKLDFSLKDKQLSTKLSELRQNIDKEKQKLDKAEGSMEELKKAKLKIPELTKKSNKATNAKEELEKQILELPEEQEYEEDTLVEMKKQFDEIKKKELEDKKKESEIKTKINGLYGDDKEFKGIIEERTKVDAQWKDFQTTMEYYSELRKEFKELQESIRKEISPQLEQYFSWVLPRITEDRYKMVKVEDDFKMKVFSEQKGDFVDIVQLSGGTRDQLLMSLRLGFSRALNAAKSSDRQFIFLDEPFSSFDSGRRDAFIDFLRNFEKTFQQIFLISHIEGLENMVDEYIRIEKDGEGHSRVLASWED